MILCTKTKPYRKRFLRHKAVLGMASQKIHRFTEQISLTREKDVALLNGIFYDNSWRNHIVDPIRLLGHRQTGLNQGPRQIINRGQRTGLQFGKDNGVIEIDFKGTFFVDQILNDIGREEKQEHRQRSAIFLNGVIPTRQGLLGPQDGRS